MKLKLLELCMLLLLFIGISGLNAQTCINTIGGNVEGSSGSVSYSVGQIVYSTHVGSTGSVAQGVQQPYEISVVTAVEEAKGMNIFVTAYPNPTTDYLTLSIDDVEISNLSYQLYEINGRLLQTEQILGNQTCIVMSNLPPASYFVKVIKEYKELKTFKITKN